MTGGGGAWVGTGGGGRAELGWTGLVAGVAGLVGCAWMGAGSFHLSDQWHRSGCKRRSVARRGNHRNANRYRRHPYDGKQRDRFVCFAGSAGRSVQARSIPSGISDIRSVRNYFASQQQSCCECRARRRTGFRNSRGPGKRGDDRDTIGRHRPGDRERSHPGTAAHRTPGHGPGRALRGGLQRGHRTGGQPANLSQR